MVDREKVIKEIECCLNHEDCDPWTFCANSCEHGGLNGGDGKCILGLLGDVLELLNEQEAVKPFIRIHDANISNGTDHVCGYCNGSFLHQHVKFCPWCGKEVKWE